MRCGAARFIGGAVRGTLEGGQGVRVTRGEMTGAIGTLGSQTLLGELLGATLGDWESLRAVAECLFGISANWRIAWCSDGDGERDSRSRILEGLDEILSSLSSCIGRVSLGHGAAVGKEFDGLSDALAALAFVT